MENPNKVRMDWYTRTDVGFELAKATPYRELSAIREGSVIRPFQCFKLAHWQFWLERLKPWIKPYDFYMSTAKVELPTLPAKFDEMEAMRKRLSAEWEQRIRGWSLFVDLDVNLPPSTGLSPEAKKAEDEERARRVEANFVDAQEAALRACVTLHRDGQPAYPVFSGTGWNVRVNEVQFDPDLNVADQVKALRAMAANVCERSQIPLTTVTLRARHEARKVKLEFGVPPVMADDTIYDVRRIFRVPFTISRKSNLVVTPLTFEEARTAQRGNFAPDTFAFTVRDRLALVQADAARLAGGEVVGTSTPPQGG